MLANVTVISMNSMQTNDKTRMSIQTFKVILINMVKLHFHHFLHAYSLRKWKYGDGKKIVFEIITDSDSTTLKT